MADVLPKMKVFLFLSIFQLMINLGILISSNNFSIEGLIGNIGGAFIPFTSLISLSLSGLPTEISLFIGVFIGIISGIQTYMIGTSIWSMIPFIDA